MTNDKAHQLGQLLKLKKYETPGTAYFEAFLDEFHRYQASGVVTEAEAGNSSATFVSVWFSRLAESLVIRPGVSGSALAGGLAVLCVAGYLAVGQLGGLDSAGSLAQSPSAPSLNDNSQGFVTAPSGMEELGFQPKELELASVSSFENDFGNPRYVTGQAPGTYESSVAF